MSASLWSQVNARTFSRLVDEACSVQTKPPPTTNSHPAGTFENLFTRSTDKNAARSALFSEGEINCAHTWGSATNYGTTHNFTDCLLCT